MPPDADAVVLHLPHDSTVIPDDLRPTLLPDDVALHQELMAMTDHHTVDLFSGVENARTVVFPVSRLVVDPERFLDDVLEPMAQRGMGVIYTTCSTGAPLRHPPTAAERAVLLARYYHPHHARLTSAVSEALDLHAYCLILDCHSFPAQSPAHELYHVDVRPDICLGTDAYHTPTWLTDAAREAFESKGHRVAIDAPYTGTIVPLAHLGSEPRVLSLMIEVNRGLYVNETTGMRLETFARHRSAIARAVRRITAVVADHISLEHG